MTITQERAAHVEDKECIRVRHIGKGMQKGHQIDDVFMVVAKRNHWPVELINAASQIKEDFLICEQGLKARDYERIKISNGLKNSTFSIYKIDASRRFQAAQNWIMTAGINRWHIVEAVILNDMTLKKYASLYDINVNKASNYLELATDKLATFYWQYEADIKPTLIKSPLVQKS